MGDISQYKILNAVGRGGFGTVYRAFDASLKRFVALKMFPRFDAQNESFIRRFKQEARAAAKLNHPNIVTVYAMGEHEGQLYIAMEFVEGETLADKVRRDGKVEPIAAAEILIGAARGLAEAHANKIVHRDVKSHNIMIDEKGRVKVTDFGLAGLIRDDSTQSDVSGLGVGTPRYMSPEQCAGKRLDARSDIYSLGTVFFELLAGKHPRDAETLAAVVHQIVYEPFPDIRSVVPDIDPGLVTILKAMVESRPADRYPSALALIEDVAAWLVEQRRGPASVDSAAAGVTAYPKANRESRGDLTDFMIHYVEADRSWANWACRVLSEAGFQTVLAEFQPDADERQLETLVAVCRHGGWVIVMLSPSYLERLERKRAWKEALALGRLLLLPLRVRKCSPDAGSPLWDYIEMVSYDTNTCERRLLDAARSALGSWGSGQLRHLTPIEWSLSPRRLGQAVSNLPMKHSLYSAPRPGALNEVYDGLTLHGGVVRLVRHETAYPGSGLSHVALDYAHANRMNYAVIWWIRAEQWAVMASDFGALAEALELPEGRISDLNRMTQAVRYWLEENDNWLLLFDGVKLWSRAASLIPDSPRGHVIVTTNVTAKDTGPRAVVIGRIRRRDAMDYLVRRTLEKNEQNLARLAARAADTPLALHLAASYVVATGLSADDVVLAYDAAAEKLQSHYSGLSRWQLCYSVFLVLALERIANESPESIRLLTLMAYVSYGGFARNRLNRSVAHLNKADRRALEHESDLKLALEKVAQFGLLSYDKDNVYIQEHLQSLIQFWLELPFDRIRGSDSPAGYLRPTRQERRDARYWPRWTVRYLHASIAASDLDKRMAWRELTPHVTKVLSHADNLKIDDVEVSELWLHLARRLSDCSMNFIAEVAYARAIQRLLQRNDSAPDVVAAGYVERAQVLRKLGRNDEAIGLYTSAAQVVEARNADDPQLSRIHQNVGEVYLQTGALAEAETSFCRAHELANRQGTPQDEVLADVAIGLGKIAMLREFSVDAERSFLRALDILLRRFGESGEPVVRVLRPLGELYLRTRDFAKARDAFEWALRCTFDHSERSKRREALCRHGLGLTMLRLGDVQAAKNHFEAALEIDREYRGRQSSEAARDHTQLGVCCRELGLEAEADEHLETARRITERILKKPSNRTGGISKVPSSQRQSASDFMPEGEPTD